jgi:HD-GYP domain-containing protein (c-di-GMP phosphodiesterase class II)
LPGEARALVVADIFDAMSSTRPYREAMPLEKVFEIMAREVPQKLDARCFEALKVVGPDLVGEDDES